jgi:MFS family permease
MLYPIMPIYLKSIGFSIFLIGILEGIAEATAGLSKGYFGKQSDLTGKRVPFVRIGYLLSAVSKPMMAVFVNPFLIFFARTTDRFGKGIRTGARDAILSDESTPETKAGVFGFHRSMDTIGAVLGPLIALIFLYYNPENYRILFMIAFVPGIIAVLFSFLIKESDNSKSDQRKKNSFFTFLNYWKESNTGYKKLIIGLLVFALFNSSDVFLILKVKQSGIDDSYVIGIYIFYNLIYALFSLPLGILADKIGVKKVFILGLTLFMIVYFGMSFATKPIHFIVLFFLYGVFSAATEGISKAWITLVSDKKDTATAIGLFSGIQSLFAFTASSITGLIWYSYGGTVAFLITAITSLFVILYFSLVITQSKN